MQSSYRSRYIDHVYCTRCKENNRQPWVLIDSGEIKDYKHQPETYICGGRVRFSPRWIDTRLKIRIRKVLDYDLNDILKREIPLMDKEITIKDMKRFMSKDIPGMDKEIQIRRRKP